MVPSSFGRLAGHLYSELIVFPDVTPPLRVSSSVSTARATLSFPLRSLFFFFNDTATTEIYTLSLHDALPISDHQECSAGADRDCEQQRGGISKPTRSEEHTSELQSQFHLVCRLLLEKKT